MRSLASITNKDIEIYVPSKGRAKNKTAKLLENTGITATYVIEKEEYDDYKRSLPESFNILVLPESNKGIAYSRRYIIDASKERFVAMLDDDVFGIWPQTGISPKGYRVHTKNNLQGICELVNCLYSNELCAISPQYTLYAYLGKNDLESNRPLTVVFVIDKSKLNGCTFDSNIETREDKDFTVQLAVKGVPYAVTNSIVKLTLSRRSKPSLCKGGLDEVYTSGADQKFVFQMQKKWGSDIVSVVREKDGSYDARINWSFIRG